MVARASGVAEQQHGLAPRQGERVDGEHLVSAAGKITEADDQMRAYLAVGLQIPGHVEGCAIEPALGRNKATSLLVHLDVGVAESQW